MRPPHRSLALALALGFHLCCAGPRRDEPRREPQSLAATLEAQAPQQRSAADEPTPSRARDPAPPLLGAREFLGSVVEDAEGSPAGRVIELWIERRTGALLALEIEREDRGESQRVDPAAFEPELDGQQVVLRSSREPRVRARLSSAHAPLFEGRELERLEGVVDGMEIELDERGIAFRTVRLLDSGNRYHRALLAPATWLENLGAAPALAARLEVRGLFTHDQRGKLFVASSLAKGAAPAIALRGAQGEPLWPRVEPEQVALARELLDAWVDLGAAAPALVVEVLLDWSGGAVAALQLSSGGELSTHPWSDLRLGAQGWSLASPSSR